MSANLGGNKSNLPLQGGVEMASTRIHNDDTIHQSIASIQNSTQSLIIVEGIDGTGKTSLTLGLTEMLGGVYQKTPTSRTVEQKAVYEQPHISTQERFDFYYDANKDDVVDINNEIKKGKIVVRDRFLASTYVNHLIRDPATDLRDILDFERSLKKIHIVLFASRETILGRLNTRAELTQFEKNIDSLMRAQELFLECNNDFTIDSGKGTVDENILKTFNFVKGLIQ